MKKLKIQTALLAICLALATTLKLSNEINAMKAKEDTNSKVPHNNDPAQQTDTNNTFIAFRDHVEQYKRRKQIKWGIPRDEYKELLSSYIQDDIPKYLSVLFLVAHYSIPIFDIARDSIYELLIKDPLEDRNGIHIIKSDAKNETISQLINYIIDLLSTDKGERTTEGKIIEILFSEYTDPKHIIHNGQLKIMQQLLQAYQKEKNTKLSPFYSKFISFLKPAADIIWQSNPYRNEAENPFTYYELPRTAIQFHEEYKNKLAKQKREKEEKEKREKEEKEKAKREKEEAEIKEKEERGRVEKIEQLKKDANKYMNKNKEPGSKISTTQKIINNLSATNNMLQIIKLILY